MTGFYLIKGEDPQGSDRTELGEQTLVGRSDECDLKVVDGHPSRRHAMLTVATDGLWVEDLGSANGTSVNGREITARTRLQHGDRIAFDLARFVVEAPEPAASAASGDATVMRRADISDATIVRLPPEPAAAPATEPLPGSTDNAPRSEAEAIQKQVPRSWADPDFQGEGTRILTAEEMRALAAGTDTSAATAAEAPAPMHAEGPHLVILTGRAAGSVFELDGDHQEWSIGTAPEREIRLDFPGVSAFHAKISHEAGRWRIIDQMSANGTFLNGQKSTISYLQHGDKLRLAQVECEFRLPAAGRAAQPRKPQNRGSVGRSRAWIIAAAVALITGLILATATMLL